MDDRYQIQEKIGQGGLGAVYRATDTQLKREVALKRLLPQEETEAATDGDSTGDLLKEATTLSSLQHPNIVTIYDVGEDDKGPFVVMELLKGETFDETVERGALTEKDFRSVVAQTMEALVAAHHEGIVHRDLKPSNLMVNWLPSGKFQIKVLDFGLAKFSKKPAVQTIDQTDAILGSIYFMAPEQFERVPLDARTDLYSIGALYYYCLTADYPFNGDSAAQVMAAHLQNRVAPLGPLRPDLPTWMCDWVMWLVSREMASRPESAQQALDFFQGERAGIVSTPPPAPGAPQLVPVAAAHPPAAAGALTAPLSGSPVDGIPAAQATGPLGAGEVSGGLPMPGVPKAKKFPMPIWAMVTIPVLLIALVATIVTKSGARRVIDERNALVVELNEAERPTGDAATVATILAFIKDQPKGSAGDTNVVGALGTLGRLQGGEVEDALVAQLPKVSAKVRAGLISIIAGRGITSALPELLKYIGDPSGEVSDIAIYGIGVLGDAGNVDTLLFELENPASEAIGDSLTSSIIIISQKGSDLSKRSRPVLNALKGAADGDYRYRLLRILGHLGGDAAWAALKTVLGGGNPDAIKAVLRGLSSWPDGAPAETLFGIVRSASDPIIRGQALRTYVLLLGAPSDTPDEVKVKRIGELLGSETPISRSTKRNLIGALAGLAVPEAKALAAAQPAGSALAGYGEAAIRQIDKTLAKRVDTAGGDLKLSASTAAVMGEGSFGYDATAGAIIGWTVPGYNVMWPIKFAAAGKYEIVVDAAAPPNGGGEYEVTLGGVRLVGKTGQSEKFKETVLGTATITAPGTYRLTVIGVNTDRPDSALMHLRAVLLKAK